MKQFTERKCPICSSKENHFLESIDLSSLAHEQHIKNIKQYNNQTINYYCCKNCGMMYLDNKINLKFIDYIYNNEYWTEPKNINRLADQFCRGRIIGDLLKFRGCTPKNILDIGGGLGGVALGIRDTTGANITIVDRSKEARKQAKIFGFGGISKISDLPDDSDPFDLAVFCHSLEHFIEPIEIIKDVKKYLNKNAHIYIEVPNAKWHSSAEVFHETMWTEKLLKQFSIIMDFENVDIWSSSSPYINCKPIYIHLLSKISKTRKPPPFINSYYYNSKISRAIYICWENYCNLMEKFPSVRFKRIFSPNHRRRLKEKDLIYAIERVGSILNEKMP